MSTKHFLHKVDKDTHVFFWSSSSNEKLFFIQAFNFEDQCQAYKYLANYHIKRGHLDEAYAAAQKCTEYNEVGTANYHGWIKTRVVILTRFE